MLAVFAIALLALGAIVLAAGRRWKVDIPTTHLKDTIGLVLAAAGVVLAAYPLFFQTPAERPRPERLNETFSLDGRPPPTSPLKSDAVGFLSLGDAPSVIEAFLGAPSSESISDMHNTPKYAWTLPGGGELTAVTSAKNSQAIHTIFVDVARGGARFAMAGDVVLGETALNDALERWSPLWGNPVRYSTERGDYVVMLAQCQGSNEILMKVRQHRNPPFTPQSMSRPVTGILMWTESPPEFRQCS